MGLIRSADKFKGSYNVLVLDKTVHDSARLLNLDVSNVRRRYSRFMWIRHNIVPIFLLYLVVGGSFRTNSGDNMKNISIMVAKKHGLFAKVNYQHKQK